MATTTNVSPLKINYLTEAQYQNALSNNNINENELYLTPTVFSSDKILPIANGGTNASTAVDARANLGLGNVENTALSTWTGTNTIATVGTITTGTWSASTIAANKGGTGITSYTIGDILYCSTANTLSRLTGNTTTTRKFLRSVAATSGTATAPVWDTVTKTDVGLSNVSNDSNLNSTTGSKGDIIYWSESNTPAHLTNSSSTTKKFLSITSLVPSWTTLAKGDVGLGNVENTALSTWTGTDTITTVGTIVTGEWKGTAIAASYIGNHSTDKLTSGTLPIGRGGTGTTTAPTQYGVIYASTTSAYASTSAGTSGQYLKSNGTSAPTWATFSASTVGLGNVTNVAQIAKATFTEAYQIMYSTAASTPAVLDANTTATKKFLRMTGTGSAGAAPAWDTLVLNDIPDLSTLYLPRSGGTLTNTAGTRINFNDGTRIQYWIGLSLNNQYQGLYSIGYLDSNSTWNESAGYIIRRINNGKVFIDFPTVIYDDTVSSSKTTGALVINGGLGVAKTIFANNLAITDNNPVIRVSGVDVTATNNGVTETLGRYWLVGDENGRGYSALYGGANSDGSVTSYLLARTYNSSESKFRGFAGIGVNMSSTGTISYLISGPMAFRNALGASSGVWPITLGGTGATTAAGARNNLGIISGSYNMTSLGAHIYRTIPISITGVTTNSIVLVSAGDNSIVNVIVSGFVSEAGKITLTAYNDSSTDISDAFLLHYVVFI